MEYYVQSNKFIYKKFNKGVSAVQIKSRALLKTRIGCDFEVFFEKFQNKKYIKYFVEPEHALAHIPETNFSTRIN